jgi:predicted phosphodiesterase
MMANMRPVAKYAVLGDIHANLEALTAVLAHARLQGVTHYACVGDLVGYNANPVECVEIVRSLDCAVVRGNHDRYCSHNEELAGFHPLAADVVSWTRNQLAPDQIEYLRELKFVSPVRHFTLVHSTLDMPHMWGYVFDKFEADANFNYQTTSVCFFGHTHVPLAFEKTSDVRVGLYSRIKVVLGRKYFINVGSVGQPRDGDPRAAYVTFDLNANEVELHRVEYDIPAAQAQILNAGLPERLAERLAVGR